MAQDFNTVFPGLLQQEGGWVFTDDKNDPGGMTYGGMTYTTLSGWLAKQNPPARMMPNTFKAVALADNSVPNGLLKFQIKCAYEDVFWKPLQLDHANYSFWPQFAIFSAAVNLDVPPVAKMIQRIVGVKADGVIGPKTLEAMHAFIREYDPKLPFKNIWQKYYIDSVQANTEEWVNYARVLDGTNTGPVNIKPPKTVKARYLEGWLNRVNQCFLIS